MLNTLYVLRHAYMYTYLPNDDHGDHVVTQGGTGDNNNTNKTTLRLPLALDAVRVKEEKNNVRTCCEDVQVHMFCT